MKALVGLAVAAGVAATFAGVFGVAVSLATAAIDYDELWAEDNE